jgi:hypothetical protein
MLILSARKEMKIKLRREIVKVIDDGVICFSNAPTHATTLHLLLSIEVLISPKTQKY